MRIKPFVARTRWGRRFVSALTLVMICTFPLFADIKYSDLRNRKIKLPYNTRVTITGAVDELIVGAKKLSDLVTIDACGAQYTVDGAETVIASTPVKGTQWSVTVGPFPENKPVDLKFHFSGKLAPSEATRVLNEVLNSTEFRVILDAFYQSATGQTSEMQLAKADIFTNALAEVVQKRLSTGIALDLDTMRTALRRVFAVLNFDASLQAWRNIVSTVNASLETGNRIQLGSTPSETIDNAKKLTDADIDKLTVVLEPLRQQLKLARKRVDDDWGRLQTTVQVAVAADIAVAATVIESALVQDLQKYAGFDGAAMYVPRLNELRSFVTVSIYPGPVSLTPEGGLQARDRWSLTLGIAIDDISGGDLSKTKIRGQNAYVYGLGFRLNKYFRLTTGALVYRTGNINGATQPATNSLRHEFFIGPSIDITALPGLKTIFASSTGTTK
jgi:hypothetical protein